jgi:hypothetical protein
VDAGSSFETTPAGRRMDCPSLRWSTRIANSPAPSACHTGCHEWLARQCSCIGCGCAQLCTHVPTGGSITKYASRTTLHEFILQPSATSFGQRDAGRHSPPIAPFSAPTDQRPSYSLAWTLRLQHRSAPIAATDCSGRAELALYRFPNSSTGHCRKDSGARGRSDCYRKMELAPKKKMRNEPTDPPWRYRKRGFPQKNEPKRTQHPTRHAPTCFPRSVFLRS